MNFAKTLKPRRNPRHQLNRLNSNARRTAITFESLEDRRVLTAAATELISFGSESDTGNDYSLRPSVNSDGRFVAFDSIASDLVLDDTNRNSDIFVRDLHNGDTVLVSSAADGTHGNRSSHTPTISDDGRFVAFVSSSTNLSPADTDSISDIYVKDLNSGEIILASVGSTGTKANGSSFQASISGNGQFVTFSSFATNLVGGDTDGQADIYVRDLINGTTRLVNTSSAGIKGDALAYDPTISDDGQVIAFRSKATNLVMGGNNGFADIYVKDLQSGTTTLASVSISGSSGNNSSIAPALSGDGRFVSFHSSASNLSPDDTDSYSDIFVRDLVTGTTRVASTNENGVKGNSSSYSPSISDDGRFVSFSSIARNLVDDDTNFQNDVFVKDLLTGAVIRASVGIAGNEGDDISQQLDTSLSDNGQHVAFYSRATNFTDADFNGEYDVFAHNVANTTTTLVSVRATELSGETIPGYENSYLGTDVAVSNDGQFVAFETQAINIHHDEYTRQQVVVRDRSDGSVFVASSNSEGDLGNSFSRSASISDDGRFVAFSSQATNLSPDDTDTRTDIYVKDTLTGAITLASVNTSGIKSNGSSYAPSISGNGQFIAFHSRATNLATSDSDTSDDIYVRDLINETTTLVTVNTAGMKANGASQYPSISDDGRLIAFQTRANNLSPFDLSSDNDVYVRDLMTGATALVSLSTDGVKANGGSYAPAISGNGEFIAFSSNGTNLTQNDSDRAYDIFRRDLLNNKTILVSTNSDGIKGNSLSRDPSISNDGRFISFESYSRNLVGDDTNYLRDVFVKDVHLGETRRASTTSEGGQSNGDSFRASISGNGEFIAFVSRATNLPGGGSKDYSDYQVYLSVPTNKAPEIADQAFNIPENSEAVFAVQASDPDDGDSLTCAITGGADAALFTINPMTGLLSFDDAADFESPLDSGGDNQYDLEITVSDLENEQDSANITVNVLNQPSITGNVFVDVNTDGAMQANEPGIDGVLIELLDEFGNAVLDEDNLPITATTSDGGLYLFEDLDPAIYQLRETQPTGVTDGAELLGSLSGEVVENDTMQLTLERTDAFDYVFMEVGQQITSGDTASIGFWQNKHGQKLINEGGTGLANWLTENFGNVFGDTFDHETVANFYKQQLFKKKAAKSSGPAKVDAHFMATALATYFTSSNLAGSVAANYGFNISDTGIGTNVVNVGNQGAAFGVANGTTMTLMQALLATNSMTDVPDSRSGAASIYDQNGDGVIDANERLLREAANDFYSAINELGDS